MSLRRICRVTDFLMHPITANSKYNFDHLAEIIGDFADKMGLKKFALYIFDYGAPVGLRVALRFPAGFLRLSARTATRMSKA
jgi:pimeloyl-ACP methyl ester carboxylesterase